MLDKVTSFELKLALLDYFRFERQWVSVDEFRGADVIADTGKKIIEVEVKISKNDLVNGERYKVLKHLLYGEGKSCRRCHPNEYYFCVPDCFIDDAQEVIEKIGNPKYGIIAFYGEQPDYEAVRKSVVRALQGELDEIGSITP